MYYSSAFVFSKLKLYTSFFFFFSSRRRHTRSDRDWSSDVCSSEPLRPAVDGLDQVTVWTNREATNVRDIPARVLLIGGSAVGVELGEFYARMGAQTTIVQRADRLMDREDPRVGELAAEALAADGITIHTGRTVTRAQPVAGGALITLDDGTQVETDVVILGAGRGPRTAGLGLEAAGVTLTGRGGIAVDDRCQAGPGLWAVGDVTGVALFTHVAKYQGRVVADNILGRGRAASYEGIPRVVFADTEIEAVGLTAAQAASRGISTATAEISVADSADRSWTYERVPRGPVTLLPARPASCSCPRPTGAAAPSWPRRRRRRRGCGAARNVRVYRPAQDRGGGDLLRVRPGRHPGGPDRRP